MRRHNASKLTFTSGEQVPGLSNSRTISFELGTSVVKKFAPHPCLYVQSTAIIAAMGAWFTPPISSSRSDFGKNFGSFRKQYSRLRNFFSGTVKVNVELQSDYVVANNKKRVLYE